MKSEVIASFIYKHSKCNGHSHYYFSSIGKIQYFLIISVYQLVPIAYKDCQEKNFEYIRLSNRLKTNWLLRRKFYIAAHTIKGLLPMNINSNYDWSHIW